MSRIPKIYKPFQHWQESSNMFVISDTHFGDSDREAMGYNMHEIQQINKINKALYGKNSTLIHLGDVGDPEYIRKINAKYKILIKGNHDKGNAVYEKYFDEIYEGPVTIHPRIILSHEPIDLPYMLNIHGHMHDAHNVYEMNTYNDKEYVNAINVAQNVYGFGALGLNEFVNNGGLKNMPDMHRMIIDRATERKEETEDEENPIG